MTGEELEKLKQDYLAKYVSDGYRCCSTCGQVAEHEATQLALSRGFDAAVSALVPDYERRLGVARRALREIHLAPTSAMRASTMAQEALAVLEGKV